MKNLDVGKLNIAIGKEFKIEGNSLNVPIGCTLDQVAEFLSKELDRLENEKNERMPNIAQQVE